MKKHQILWFKDLGAAYLVANAASEKGSKILELYPFGSRGHLFLESSSLSLEELMTLTKVTPEKSFESEDLSEKVLSAYLSLSNPPLEEELLIIEAEFIGDVFEAAQIAMKVGLSILDLRFIRDTSGHSYCQVTGRKQAVENFLMKVPFACAVTRVSNPSSGLKEFFPIS